MKLSVWFFRIALVASVLSGGALSLGAQTAASQEELPWYFPAGVVHSTDPVIQKQEYYRYYAAGRACFQGSDRAPALITGNDSIRVVTKVVSTSSITENPAVLTLVFDHWIYTGDETLARLAREQNISLEEARKRFRVRVTTQCEQRFISQHEFDVASADLLKQANLAADNDFAFYKDLEKKAVAARALELGVPESDFRKYLDDKVEGTEVTYREMNLLPRPHRRSDFVPRELHLAASPEIEGILGVAWLDTGVVYYNPQGRVEDYLEGYPRVLQHEVVHDNTNLQEWPMGGFDQEQFADIPGILNPDDTLEIFGHSYSRNLREWIEVYFGYDFALARKESFGFDLGGNIIINAEKYRENIEKLKQIQAVLLPFFEDKVMPEFYSKRAWWVAMNDRRHDDSTVVEMMLAENFDPVILDGHNPTMLWLQANTDKIRGWARDAWKKTKEKSDGGGFELGGSRSQAWAIDLYQRQFTKAEQTELERRCHADQKACDALLANPEKLVEYLKNFKADHGKGGTK